MLFNKLGNSDIEISKLGLGTVEIGLNYGITKGVVRPDESAAISLLHRAIDKGINIFDTAPGYGCSEDLLGKALGEVDDCVIATKVNIPQEGKNFKKAVLDSLERSCKKLRKKSLDIVQIHNATKDTFLNTDMLNIQNKEKQKGNIRLAGASVYGVEDALAGIHSGMVDVLQVVYNILDQRAYELFELAESRGIGIFARSVYFKGALTQKVELLPEGCNPLKKHVKNVKNKMGLNSWEDLSATALRFALSAPEISSVLVGTGSEKRLDFAVNVEKQGELSQDELLRAYECAVTDDFWLNPLNWIKHCDDTPSSEKRRNEN